MVVLLDKRCKRIGSFGNEKVPAGTSMSLTFCSQPPFASTNFLDLGYGESHDYNRAYFVEETYCQSFITVRNIFRWWEW